MSSHNTESETKTAAPPEATRVDYVAAALERRRHAEAERLAEAKRVSDMNEAKRVAEYVAVLTGAPRWNNSERCHEG